MIVLDSQFRQSVVDAMKRDEEKLVRAIQDLEWRVGGVGVDRNWRESC